MLTKQYLQYIKKTLSDDKSLLGSQAYHPMFVRSQHAPLNIQIFSPIAIVNV